MRSRRSPLLSRLPWEQWLQISKSLCLCFLRDSEALVKPPWSTQLHSLSAFMSLKFVRSPLLPHESESDTAY